VRHIEPEPLRALQPQPHPRVGTVEDLRDSREADDERRALRHIDQEERAFSLSSPLSQPSSPGRLKVPVGGATYEIRMITPSSEFELMKGR
jgi:hypothetical protein